MKKQIDNTVIEMTAEEEAEYLAQLAALDVDPTEAMKILFGGGEE